MSEPLLPLLLSTLPYGNSTNYLRKQTKKTAVRAKNAITLHRSYLQSQASQLTLEFMQSQALSYRTARRVRLLMEEQGKTVQQLATLLNISLITANSRFSGTTQYTLDEAAEVATWLQTSLGNLLAEASTDRELVNA